MGLRPGPADQRPRPALRADPAQRQRRRPHLALAAAGSEPRFVAQMNRYAAALGLTDTHYANPVGLDQSGNYSSARDLATLTQHLLRDPRLRQDRRLRAAPSCAASTRSGGSRRSTSCCAMAPWVTGVKTGHTFGALYVLVGSGRRKGVELISVAIGAPTDEDRFSDNLDLLEYGFSQYKRRLPVNAGAGPRRPVDPLLRRRAAAARRAQRRRRPAPRPAAERRRAGAAARSRGRSSAAPRWARATVFVDGQRAGAVPLRAGRAVCRRRACSTGRAASSPTTGSLSRWRCA